MTDAVLTPAPRKIGIHTDDAAKARLKARYAAERRFKWMGAGAVALAGLFLALLLSTIIGQALPAFRAHYVTLPVDLSSENVDPGDIQGADYGIIAQEALSQKFPDVTTRQERRALRGLISTGSGVLLRREVQDNPALLGGTAEVALPLDDFPDLYLKDMLAERGRSVELAGVTVTPAEDEVQVAFPDDAVLQLATELGVTGEGGALELDDESASFLLGVAGGTVKLQELTRAAGGGVTATGVLYEALDGPAADAPAVLRTIRTPESDRKITDREIVWLDELQAQGLIEERWNTIFFTSGASREAELAGIWGATVGSFLTLLVTLAVSFPIGVAAAIYLEEFAPKNRFTSLIEVNINNLAAVPSIVFGLLGLAVFLNWFGMPRSAPVVGGLVLALMTLPIIIIASRASLRAVPPSIREAALGVGASKIQTVFHHVLPLAMPGIMTGTILGMAHALGETAPLLMIGMVAFIVDIPGGFTEPATILPVQIFMWADFPEPGFQQKTSAAILILLGFLILMNAVAVILRKRFERRW